MTFGSFAPATIEKRRDRGIVDTTDDRPTRPHVLREDAERFDDARETTVVLEVVRLDVRDHGDLGPKLVKGAVVLVSMFVLTVGLLSLAAVFSMAMASTQTSQLDMTAKQMASETMESIFTARQTTQLPWDSIQNTNAGGIFVGGFQPIYKRGQ